MRRLDGVTDSLGVSLSKPRGKVKDGSLACCGPWGRGLRQDQLTEQLWLPRLCSELKS